MLRALLNVHISCGALALLVLWIPMVAKKGGALHRRAGWIYACAMWLAALTAWAIAAFRLEDTDPSNDSPSVFLAYVALLVANGAATGIRVLRTKRRTAPSRNLYDLGSSAALLLASVALLVYGRAQSNTLFLAFSGLGVFLSIGQLRFWLRPPSTKLEWWYKHMGAMLAACIGTVTAFLVVNAGNLGLHEYRLLVWLSPGVLGGVGIALWQRHYRRRFEASPQGQSA